MTCYHPLDAQQFGHTKSGAKKIIFKNHPDFTGGTMQLPCGQCHGCKLDRSITWAARCMHEAQMHDDNQFITLTYDKLPQYGSLTPHHFVDFMKRYRKNIEPKLIRFYDSGIFVCISPV